MSSSAPMSLTKPLTMFRLPILVGAIVMFGFAASVLIQGPFEFHVAARAPAGSPLTSTLDGKLTLNVFTDQSSPADTDCFDGTGRNVSIVGQSLVGDRRVDGVQWYATAVDVELTKGETVTCTSNGATQVLLGHRTGLFRILEAGMYAAVGAIGLVAFIVGSRGSRGRQRALGDR